MSRTLTDREALLRAILDHPDEDVPRLMFADEIEAGGERARAEFIRDQVWLWAHPSCGSCTGPEWAAGKPCGECREREQRRGRCAVELFGRKGWLRFADGAERLIPTGARWDDYIEFRRGFVEVVHCGLREWLHYGPGLVKKCPTIRTANLMDVRPSPLTTEDGRVEWTFFIGTIHTGYHVPQGIYYRLRGAWRFSSLAASEALELAAVAWAKDENRLPF